ncbi:MAG: hypothetical protein ACK5W9_11170 [Bdellovibrionales bacterium]
MKRSLISITTSVALLAQPLMLPQVFAQNAASNPSANICQVSSSLKSKLSTILQEESAKTVEVKNLAAQITKSIELDNTKDGIKKVLRIIDAVFYLLDGDVTGFAASVSGSIIAGSEDAIDLKSLTDAQIRVNAAVQRQVDREAALASILKNTQSLDCESQAKVLAASLSQVSAQRIGFLTASISALKSLESQADASYDMANSYWKRPGFYGGVISAAIGGIMLYGGVGLARQGSKLLGPGLAILGGIALAAGGVGAYTSHLEVVRARKYEAAELALIKSEMARQAAELTMLKSATDGLLQSLN